MAYYILKAYKLNLESWQAFLALSRQKNCFFLDSSLNGIKRGRFSFLGANPFYIFQTKDRLPFATLREVLDKYRISHCPNNLPFFGGAVGYLSYDLGFLLEEKLKRKNPDDLKIPYAFFAFYNTLIIIDHHKKIFYLLALGYPEKKYHLSRVLAKSNFQRLSRLLARNLCFTPLKKGDNFSSLPEANFKKEEYLLAVKKALDYIKRGDIYQVNLSQRFKTQIPLSAPEIYRRLRGVSPSCFSAYLDCQEFQILSSSPERFLYLEKDKVFTVPMKGTRPRGKNPREDRFYQRSLLQSVKDKAELLMIVDLERNDLGRVCKFNTVRVETLRRIERYRTVFQTTATISGSLQKGKDRMDLLSACFPGGSVTGCPKIRAMQIIEELEPHSRSIYTGVLGYLSFCGGMDFNILIRTLLKKDNQLYFGVGGGIVADSDPEEEYEETLVKARGMLEALK